MLVLTRKQNEKIRIGENITITVIRMKGKGVRLGIEAPKNVNVLRGELLPTESNDEADIHCGNGQGQDSAINQAAEETVLDYRIARNHQQHFSLG